MSDTDKFLREASDLGADVHQDIFRKRTRELQRYLIATSGLVVLVALGVYSVKEVTLGPAVLIAHKSGWVSLFAMVSVTYFLALYLVACWSDLSRHGFKAWKSVEHMKKLTSSAQFNLLEVNHIFGEMLEVAAEHKRFLESKGIEADDSDFRERSNLLKDQLVKQSKVGLAKNRVLKDIDRGSVWTRRLSLVLELGIPVFLAFLALGLLLTTAQWQW